MRLIVGFVVAVFLAVFIPIAHADSINFSDPTITPSGSNFLWTYTATVDEFEHVNTAQNPSFISLYDIPGIIGSPSVAALSSAAVSVSVQNVGLTPALQTPTDNPNIPNITTTYSGSAPTNTPLSTLSFLDVFGPNNETNGNFSAQATNNTGNVLEANTSSVPVPTPEPGTLALFLSGIGAMGLVIRRMRG